MVRIEEMSAKFLLTKLNICLIQFTIERNMCRTINLDNCALIEN